jgi:hypothetical protein
METMRKPWVHKRKGVKGWWVGWYEGGKRKAKALPNKALGEPLRHIKYSQLNAGVFTSVVSFDWQQMVEEYRQLKQVEGLWPGFRSGSSRVWAQAMGHDEERIRVISLWPPCVAEKKTQRKDGKTC